MAELIYLLSAVMSRLINSLEKYWMHSPANQQCEYFAIPLRVFSLQFIYSDYEIHLCCLILHFEDL